MRYFRDGTGHIVERIARQGLTAAAAEPCGPGSLRTVGEIGLAADAVPALVERAARALADVYGRRRRDWLDHRRAARADPVSDRR